MNLLSGQKTADEKYPLTALHVGQSVKLKNGKIGTIQQIQSIPFINNKSRIQSSGLPGAYAEFKPNTSRTSPFYQTLTISLQNADGTGYFLYGCDTDEINEIITNNENARKSKPSLINRIAKFLHIQ